MSEPRKSMAKRLWPFVKWSLFALVVYFVVERARKLWDPSALDSLSTRPGWLVLAGVAYVVGWLPSVWFWRTLLARLGDDVPFVPAARAYYCGHLGKYIPGKALVLVIRAGLLKGHGTRPSAAALTAAYETLAMMAVGAALGVALAPSVLPASFWESAPVAVGWLWDTPLFRTAWTTPGVLPGMVAVVSIAVLPLLAKLASLAAGKMVPDEFERSDEPRDDATVSPSRAFSARLFATGMLVLILAWWIHGLSLGCVVTAVTGQPFDLANWPAWTSAVSLATSLGFLAIFAPGGVGVREWVLLEVLRLQPGVSPEAAVAAAVLLRIVWFATELVVAAALFWGVRPKPSST